MPFLPFFRKPKKEFGPRELVVAVTGVQLGERLLQIGPGYTEFFIALATTVGLSGRAYAVPATDDAADSLKKAAERAGIYVEIEAMPPARSLPSQPGDTFDIVVVDGEWIGRVTPEERVRSLQESYRLLRPAGRIVIVERAPRGGLGALVSKAAAGDSRYAALGGAIRALEAEGFRPVRVTAERAGLRFIEGLKPRT